MFIGLGQRSELKVFVHGARQQEPGNRLEVLAVILSHLQSLINYGKEPPNHRAFRRGAG